MKAPEFFFTMGSNACHNPCMKRMIVTLSVLLLLSSSPAHFTALPFPGPGPAEAAPAERAAGNNDANIPLSFKSVVGTWALKYSGNYGYTFSFYSNYRAVVVLSLNMETLVFKGVYTIEEGSKLKINIYEMKEEHRSMGTGKGFVKAKSSYFLFGGHKTKKGGRETLYLRPLKIMIDGNNSEGYFEPLIKLAKK